MKIVISALNSRYIHMSLAPWYLKSSCGTPGREIRVMELSINQSNSEILHPLFYEKPDIVAFCCYIFNISRIESIVSDLKQILPDTIIILGGPEVSYDAAEVLNRNPDVDFVITLEGEQRLNRLLQAIEDDTGFETIDGLAYRRNGGVQFNPAKGFISELDSLPSPYTDEMLKAAIGKIMYFESSRGCPFHCAYCLSPTYGGVRIFSMPRVKNDLLRLMTSSARQVKFVDRTFNCHKIRAKEIIGFILDKYSNGNKTGPQNYHFETAADLFDDELIDMVAASPAGLFQFEIGIQSMNEKTLSAVSRKTDTTLCAKNIKKLIATQKAHVHLDLIAGLPYEGLSSFAESFNSVFSLSPHCIQLGFLKLLKGSDLRTSAEQTGTRYSANAPYEVLSTPWLSYAELDTLGWVETCVDKLYNSGKFKLSVEFIAGRFKSPFTFFLQFAQLVRRRFPEGYGIPQKAVYEFFAEFAENILNPEEFEVFIEKMKFDFYCSDSSCNPPACLKKLTLPEARTLYQSEKHGSRVHYERFALNPLEEAGTAPVTLRFDYGTRNSVTGCYAVSIL